MMLRMDPYIPLTIRDKDGAIINFNNKGNEIIENIKSAGFSYKGKTLFFETEKPRWESAVHDAFFGTRVEWVLVLDVFYPIDNSLGFHALGDEFIGRPNLDAVIIGITHAKPVEFVGILWYVVAVFV